MEVGSALSAASRAYLAAVAERIASRDPGATAARVGELVSEHLAWRSGTLNLLPSDNTTSPGVLALLGSAIATRVTEGFPGDKEFPPPRHNREIDEIEGTLIVLAGRLLRAPYIEWRATSNTMANAMALEAITKPGDLLLVQALTGGANMSYHPGAVPDLLRLRVEALPTAPEYGIDVDAARVAARRLRPRVIVVGGGYCLFPLPVRELRAIADEVGADLLYDAAHSGPLIAFTGFQDPLAEGADLLTLGTHKVMGGPVGGLVAMRRADLAERIINRAHPLFLQTRDQNKFAAAAYALAELTRFGSDYAHQMVRNAQTLAAALEAEGIAVLGRDRGYTRTHQVVVDVAALDSAEVERRAQECGLLVHRARLPGEDFTSTNSGLRLSVQEITRLGMNEPEMPRLARLLRRAAADREPPSTIAPDVAALAREFSIVRYSFSAAGAPRG